MNDKSIVVIDTPKNCRVCPFRTSPWSFCLGEYEKENHCPLRPLPSHMELELTVSQIKAITVNNSFRMGWNMCLGEILGENK